MSESKIYRRVSTKGLAKNADVQRHPQEMRFLWRVHVQSALRRGVPLGITIDDYARMSSLTCHYCGREPESRAGGPNTTVLANSVDRVDNTAGYTPLNVVPCCKRCNAMKSELGAEEFLAHVARISAYQSA